MHCNVFTDSHYPWLQWVINRNQVIWSCSCCALTTPGSKVCTKWTWLNGRLQHSSVTQGSRATTNSLWFKRYDISTAQSQFWCVSLRSSYTFYILTYVLIWQADGARGSSEWGARQQECYIPCSPGWHQQNRHFYTPLKKLGHMITVQIINPWPVQLMYKCSAPIKKLCPVPEQVDTLANRLSGSRTGKRSLLPYPKH